MSKRDVNFINLNHGNTFALNNSDKIQTDIKLNKKAIIGSRLYYNDIITHSFKLDKQYSPQELSLTIELKMYEDLGLDTQKIYQISHIQKHTEIDNILLIEAFAFDTNTIKEKYATSLKYVKYLEYLTIPSLTYEVLYSKKMIPISNDVFIYIDEEEAFITFYKDGSYISSKKIKSISEMVKELNSKNIYITIDELKTTLHTKGITKESYELTEYALYDYLHTVFEQIFSTIKNLALHSRNIYNFAQLEKVYFDLDGKVISGLDTLIPQFVENTSLHAMDMFKDTDRINFLDLLSAHYIQDKIEKDDHALNITFYEKKVPFHKTEVGKFSLIVAAGIALASLYPIYQQYEIYTLSEENLILQERVDTLSVSAKKLQKQQKTVQQKIAEYTKEEKKINQDLTKLQDIANTLLALKSNDAKYTTMLLTINTLLKKYELTLTKVEQSGEKMMDLELYSKNNRRDTIALFMQELLAMGYENVYSNEIKLNETSYRSIVTVKR